MNCTVEEKVPLSGVLLIRGPEFRRKIVSLSVVGGQMGANAHGQEISQPPDDNRKVNQRPETISKANVYNCDRRLKQHRVQRGLESGVKRSKEGREIAFLSGDADESSSGEERS